MQDDGELNGARLDLASVLNFLLGYSSFYKRMIFNKQIT